MRRTEKYLSELCEESSPKTFSHEILKRALKRKVQHSLDVRIKIKIKNMR